MPLVAARTADTAHGTVTTTTTPPRSLMIAPATPRAARRQRPRHQTRCNDTARDTMRGVMTTIATAKRGAMTMIATNAALHGSDLEGLYVLID